MKKEKKKDGLQRLQARTTHGSGAGGYPLVLRGDAPLHRCAGLRIRALVHPHPARRKKMPGMVDGGCARACTARRLHLRSAQGMLWLAGTSPLLCTGTPGGAPARCPPPVGPKNHAPAPCARGAQISVRGTLGDAAPKLRRGKSVDPKTARMD